MNVLACKKKRNKDYNDGYAAGREEGINNAVEYMLLSFIQFLGDKRGWSIESILKAVKWVHKHAVMIVEEYTSYGEVKTAVKEEYGIIIDDGRIIFNPDFIKKG